MRRYRQLILPTITISLLNALIYGCGPLPHRGEYQGGEYQAPTTQNAMPPQDLDSDSAPIDRRDSSSTAETMTAGAVSGKTPHAGKSMRYQKLMAQYNAWRGVPHRDGGSDRRGIDCSAFVERTFIDQFHMRVPGTTDVLKNFGSPVSRRNLQVGDLVMFKTGIIMRHVGIYLGNGQMLHVSSRRGVSISPINSGYWNDHYWQSRRVF